MFYFFIFCLIGSAFGDQINEPNVNWEPESPTAKYLGLAAGASSVVPNIRATFSCIGRNYGYFADVDNDCKIFHVCHPSKSANGEPVIYQFSKFCPKTTRFDQRQLTCVSETDPKLIPCIDSIKFYPITESRLSEAPVVVQHLEHIQQFPEIEQRVEQQVLLEEPRGEAFPVKGIQSEARLQPVLNEGIPAKTIARSEPLPQALPIEQRAEPIEQVHEPVLQRVEQIPEQFIQQRAEPFVPQMVEPFTQQRAEPLPVQQNIPIQNVVNQPIPQTPFVRNVVSVQPHVLSVKEPVVPVVQRSQALKQELTPQVVRAVAPVKHVAPALALRNTQPVPAPVSAPVQITRPVLVQSDTTLRRDVPFTQYSRQSLPQVQPLYVQPQQYVPQQYIQPQQLYYLPQLPRVIRPSSQYNVPNGNTVAQQSRVVQYVPVQTTYQTVPQYLRTNIQPIVVPNVVRPSANPNLIRVVNKK